MWVQDELKKLLVKQMSDQDIADLASQYVNNESSSFVRDALVKLFLCENQEQLSDQRREFIEEFISQKLKFEDGKGKKNKKKQQLLKQRRFPGGVQQQVFKCFCMATVHQLYGNCLSCGKIACVKENKQICAFCGEKIIPSDPSNKQNQSESIITAISGVEEAPENQNELIEKSFREDADKDSRLTAAILQRDKLIRSDKQSAQKLSVIDEHNDWYQLSKNMWLTTEQRKYASRQVQREKEIKQDLETGINLKFIIGNDEIKIEDDKKEFDEEASRLQAEEFQMQSTYYGNAYNVNHEQKLFRIKEENTQLRISSLSNNLSLQFKKLKVKETILKEFESSLSSLTQALKTENPFKEFQQIFQEFQKREQAKKLHFSYDQHFFNIQTTDQGMCLSMHQPWASLLIHGFKRYEGRQWTTNYRGPLWIHSTSKKPSIQLISTIEQSYRNFYNNYSFFTPQFPDRYPTSQLIGCLDLIDVLPLKKYRERIPDQVRQPSTASYQFVVRNPRYLVVPRSMKGKPGIYQLQQDKWKGAQSGLRQVQTGWWPQEKYKFYQIWQLNPMRDDWDQENNRLISKSQELYPEIDLVMQRKNSIQNYQNVKGFLLLKSFIIPQRLNATVKQLKQLIKNFTQILKFQKHNEYVHILNYLHKKRPSTLMGILKEAMKSTNSQMLQQVKQNAVLDSLQYYFIQSQCGGDDQNNSQNAKNSQNSQNMYNVEWKLKSYKGKKSQLLEPIGMFINNGNNIELEIEYKAAGGKRVNRNIQVLESGDLLVIIPNAGDINIKVKSVSSTRVNGRYLNVKDKGALITAIVKN